MIWDQPAAQGLQSLTHWILIVILPLIGIAGLTMAIIQTAKNMLPLRQWFQRDCVNSWLAARARSARSASPAINVEQAKTDLVHLATAGDSGSLYSLPIEQLCGQINAASQVILDYPVRYWNLLRCLASQSNPDDLAAVNVDPKTLSHRKELLRRAATDLTNDEHDEVDDFVGARNRVSHQIQRAVDALQISIGFRWKFWMQLASIILSAVLAALAVIASGHSLSSAHAIGFIALAAIFSGILAPIVRDLVASIEQVRT